MVGRFGFSPRISPRFGFVVGVLGSFLGGGDVEGFFAVSFAILFKLFKVFDSKFFGF